MTTRPPRHFALPARAFILRRLYRQLAHWYRQRKTRHILTQLDDDHLRDIGLKREDIQRLYR
ncbi:DUF1127 domain-containing protein [Dickeya dianthicola]|uniref:DUF1127 domain-containing protein n=1 Tax=Dickeya dianthicola TaxID=204039 RepID=UPI001868AAE7|nr:DUF1127 domain-containing protein [Dickeya dianthicola]QOL12949.1 DUF1127 domain-containing protein [Dickeya dianthicola]